MSKAYIFEERQRQIKMEGKQNCCPRLNALIEKEKMEEIKGGDDRKRFKYVLLPAFEGLPIS